MMWFPMKWIDVRIRRIVFVNHPFSASRPVASRPTCTSGTKRSTSASMSLESSASAYRYGSCRIAACDSMRSRRSSTVAGVQVPSRDTVNAPLDRLDGLIGLVGVGALGEGPREHHGVGPLGGTGTGVGPERRFVVGVGEHPHPVTLPRRARGPPTLRRARCRVLVGESARRLPTRRGTSRCPCRDASSRRR